MIIITRLIGPFLLATTVASAFQLRISSNEDIAAEKGPFNKEFTKLVDKTLKSWKVPGLAIAVLDGDDTWAQGYGIATFPSTPATPETLWQVGSTTKAFTAAAMSFLVDDNETHPNIKWDTPISQIIRDDFVLDDDYITNHATIEDALSHRTGMPRHDFAYGDWIDGHRATDRDTVRSLRHLPLTAELRTKWQYCNMMYVVASYVIEKITGSVVVDVIKSRILDPLDMRSTYFDSEAARKAPEHYAQGYYYDNGSYHEAPEVRLPELSGAGSMISNVLDYTKWIKVMIDQAPPLSKAAHKALRKPRSFDDVDEPAYTGPTAYTLGWTTRVYQGHEFFQHGGGMEAFGANVIFFPKLRYGLVAFGNVAVYSNFAEAVLQWHLIDEKLGIPKEHRVDWNKKFQDNVDEKRISLQNAKSTFYPSIPDPALPLSLPISSYAGTYFHPGYRSMAITLPPSTPSQPSSSSLQIRRSNATLRVIMDLEHVSGEYFLGQVDLMDSPNLMYRTAFPAEFRLGNDGTVKEFGAVLEPAMGEEKIWFARI